MQHNYPSSRAEFVQMISGMSANHQQGFVLSANPDPEMMFQHAV